MSVRVAGLSGLAAADFENADLIEQLILEKNRADEARVRAEQSNLAKSKFLAAASHDLRQPLNSLRLFAATLKSKVVDNEQQELAANIDRSVVALQQLFDALMDISRLDSGEVAAARRDVDLQSALTRICSGFRVVASHKHIDLNLDCPDLTVTTDPLLFERVLNNLVSNAIRYTSIGSVTVSAKAVGDAVQLEVRDTGCGIPEQMHDLVFSEFVQLDNPESDCVEGHGLGLSIVRRVTDLLDIAVELDSSPAWGTAFTLTLNKGSNAKRGKYDSSTEATIAPSSWIGADTTLDTLFVCVIEHEQKAQLALKRLLESWGCIVLVAADADEIKHRLTEYEYDPDVIIANARLRGQQTGVDAISRLQTVVGRHLPAMIISDDADSAKLCKTRSCGWPVMPKPIDKVRLQAFLNRVR